MDKHVYHCGECGSFRIQIAAWIDANRGTDPGGDSPIDDNYCPRCEDMRSLRYVYHSEGKGGWFDWNEKPQPNIRAAVRSNLK